MQEQRGLRVRRPVPIPIQLMGLSFDEGFRADLIIEDALLVELKLVENSAPVHAKQVLTYLRLLKMPLGLLINFGAATFKEGVKRIVNNHQNFAASRPRVNHSGRASREDAKARRGGRYEAVALAEVQTQRRRMARRRAGALGG